MSTASGRSPNVLLIVLDSVRASNTSLHGHDSETTPFLDSFSEGASTYRQARAPGTESISSHTSLFTGLAVREHGITNRHDRLKPGHTVWETLSDNGYETAIFSNNPFLTELPVGLRDTFEHVVAREEENPFPNAVNPKNFVIDTADEGPTKYLSFLRAAAENGHVLRSIGNGIAFKFRDELLPSPLQSNSTAELYADRFLGWESNREGPWAACINLMDAHYPYEPGAEFDHWGGDQIQGIQDNISDQAWEFVAGDRPWGERRAVEALYDGAVRRMDSAVERIVSTLESTGKLDETLVVVTADHGEGFGERSRVRPEARIVGHGNGGLHEHILHVPLVVKYPGQTAAEEVNEVTSLTAFPNAVRDAVDGTWGRESFLVDEPVVCSTEGIDPDTSERAADYCDTISPYDEPADAVYRNRETAVEKQVRWGSETRRLCIRNAGSAWVSGRDVPLLDEVVAELSERDVRVSSEEEVSEEVTSRLEDLGYA